MATLFAIIFVHFILINFVSPQSGICQNNAGFCIKINATNYINCYISNNNNTSSVAELLKICSNNYTLAHTVNIFKNYPSTGGDLTIGIELGQRIQNVYFENNADDDYIHLKAFEINNYLTNMRFSYLQGRFFLDSSNFFNNFRELRIISSSYSGSYVFAEETPSFTNLKYLTSLELQLLILNEPMITANMVSGLRNLVKLDLINSNFQKIEPNAFQDLSNLKELHLHNNNISELNDDVFSDLTSLEELNLEGNNIRVATKDAFNGLDNVTTLDFSRNPDFPLENLLKFKAVKVLYLEKNEYTYFNPEILQQLKSLERIYFSNNPFNCNCDMQWASYLAQFGIELLGASCNSPILAVGLPISSLELYTECDKLTTFQCFNKNVTCPKNQLCFNTEDDGYTCGCFNGFSLTNEGLCEDANECLQANGGCEHVCSNSIGGYECKCREGYKKSSINPKQCIEITVTTNTPGTRQELSDGCHHYFVWALVTSIACFLLLLFICPLLCKLIPLMYKMRKIQKWNEKKGENPVKSDSQEARYHEITDLPAAEKEDQGKGEEIIQVKSKRYQQLPDDEATFESKM